MSGKIQCPSCGKNIKATSVYCGYCGAEVKNILSSSTPTVAPAEKVKVCTVCGAQMNERANFCGKCGGELVLKKKSEEFTTISTPTPPIQYDPISNPEPPSIPTPGPTTGIKYPAGAEPVSPPPAKPVSHGFRMTTPDDLL